MIVIKVMGGLGNQMFQYAFGRSLEECGREVKYDLSYFDSIPAGDTIRVCELDEIVPDLPKATKWDLIKYTNIFQQLLRIMDAYMGTRFSVIRTEESKNFDISFYGELNKYLIGYWQNEKYFINIREILLNDFCFPVNKLNERNKKLIWRIRNSENAVAVHVRGGDYFSKDNIKIFGGICTPEYYKRAFEYFGNMFENVNFFLFTNDVEWVKVNVDTDCHNIEVVDWNDKAGSWVDMYLMSICNHNVIANSSYSWWSAWMNQNENKVVIAPARWTNSDTFSDITPASWVTLD